MTSTYIKINSSYKKGIRVLRCANYVYLDEINSFNFKKISKYNKSKNIYDKVDYDFKLVNKLINNKDLLKFCISFFSPNQINIPIIDIKYYIYYS